MKKLFRKAFVVWLPFAAVIVFVSLLGYGLVQQDLRQSAYDPQVQAAQDIASEMSLGAPAQEIVPPGQAVNIAKSLDTYIIIYDASGAPLASSASLDGAPPSLPTGVFSYTTQRGEDRFTWQPAPGVRGAVVVTPWTNTGAGNPALGIPTSTPGSGFVLAGRSLTEVEQRIERIGEIAALACLAGLIVMFFIVWGALWIYEKER